MTQKDLRLILTKDCNYKCTFCHHEGVNHEIFQTLNNQDYLFLYDIVKQRKNIEGVTLTGGEPLMYNQILDLSRLLYENGAKITLVTNGSLLHKYPDVGKWLNRINISLHSLDQDKYSEITQTRTKLDHILANIALIKKQHKSLVIRLNATIVKGRNDNIKDISAMVDIADQYGLSIKFVELYPNTEPNFVALQSVESILIQLGFQKYQETNRQKTYVKGKRIIILSKIFCGYEEDSKPQENDIFVSPDGLVSPYPTDQKKVSIYNSIKTRNIQETLDLIDKSTEDVSQQKQNEPVMVKNVA